MKLHEIDMGNKNIENIQHCTLEGLLHSVVLLITFTACTALNFTVAVLLYCLSGLLFVLGLLR